LKVIVTGASGGIGRGIATVLAGSGCAVGVLARSGDKLESLREEISAAGGTCHASAIDLRSEKEAAAGLNALAEALGGVDALINNAGLVILKSALDLEPDEWRAMVETNINGLFYATRAVLPGMIDRGSGHIVNISSISGYFPLGGGSGYAATKYAVTGFSESLFHEVREHGIKVTTVFPGSVDSDSHRHRDDDGSWKVKPEEVGKAILDLLNTDAGNCISRLEIRPLSRPPKS
jgi:NADP-dependent 3-hydroxy acid dehydrogenase YdfG